MSNMGKLESNGLHGMLELVVAVICGGAKDWDVMHP